MLPKFHFLHGLLISLILFPSFKGHILIFLAATVLIDFDHYLIYAVKKKDLSLENAYIFLKKLEEKQKNPGFKGRYTFFLCVFHTFEFLLILSIFAFFNKFLFFIFLGFIFHLSLDIISTKWEFKNKYFFYYLKTLFLAYHLLSRDKETFGKIKVKL